MYIIGVDGGGTKTDFVLCKENGMVINRVIEAGTNMNNIGFENFCLIIKRGLVQLLNGIEPEDAILFGGFSGGSTSHNKEVIYSFLKQVMPFSKVGNDSDILNVISLGLDTNDGVAVIAGTGSIAYAQKKGSLYRVGGWGYLFDPSGSGYHIGKDAIYAALSEYDGSGNTTLLTKMLEQKIGLSVQDALSDIYQKGKDYIASLAPVVFSAYRENDREAVLIIEKAAAHIAKLINVSGSHLDQREVTVVFAGGLFKSAEILLPLLKKYLSGKEYHFVIPDLPPVYGAVLRACRQGMVNVGDDFINNFKKTLKEKSI